MSAAAPRSKGTAPLADGRVASSPNVYTWADYTMLDELYVRKLPEPAHRDVVCVVGCAVLTGAGAVINSGSVKQGDRVVVIGTGGVGLSAVAAARVAGAERILAIDVADDKVGAGPPLRRDRRAQTRPTPTR